MQFPHTPHTLTRSLHINPHTPLTASSLSIAQDTAKAIVVACTDGDSKHLEGPRPHPYHPSPQAG